MLFILRLALVAIALVAAFVPLAPPLVDRLYSAGVYPPWQRAVTALSNRVPFSLLDVLIAIVALRAFVLLARMVWPGSRGWLRAVVGSVVRLAALGAFLYLAFLASWGLNYRRPALASRLDYSADRATTAAASTLAHRLAAGANRLHGKAHGAPSSSWEALGARLAPSFAAVQKQLGGAGGTRPGRPKWSALTFYFERAGVDGMTDPFFLEVLVNRQLLPFERPAVLAHEWAHLAGFADESEANLVGWLMCLQGPPDAQYSAHLAILWDLIGSLPPAERSRASRELGEGPRADLRAIAERVAKTTPALRRVSWNVYDRYLKANRVETGVQSYGAALRLLLGTRLDPEWKPARRPVASRAAGDGA